MQRVVSSRYEIVEELGRGGMGVVYKAKDLQLARPVALKFLPEDLAPDHSSLSRLRREAVTASALNHPNICTIYEIGDSGSAPYIAMEFIEGSPLSDRIGAHGLPPEHVRSYALQLSDALSHAHSRAVIHRDLKSSNVMVTAGDRIKVLDFGIAKLLPTAEADRLAAMTGTLTTPGMVTGTLQYIAPEVFFGEPASELSDIWSFGVVLYEMVTGKLPFDGRTAFELGAIVLREPAPRLPEHAAAFDKVLGSCLEKEPADRFQSASELHAALEALDLDTSRGRAAQRRKGSRRQTSRRPGQIRSLAVLPMENLTGDPEQDYIADALTESLLTDFAQVSALRVISRSSVMRYKDARKPMPEIARELNVDAVVEGSVQREGNRIRVTTRLVHAPTDTQLWAQSYERDVADLLALQRDLTQSVVSEIKVKLRPRERARLSAPTPGDRDANDAYLRGIYHFDRMELDRGMQYFRQAVTLDPGHADAFGRLARGYYYFLFFSALSPKGARDLLNEAASNAIAIDKDQAEAYGYRALAKLYYDWDWAGAEADFKRALELKPSHAELRHAYGHYLMVVGRGAEALKQCQHAAELDPLGLILTACLGWHCLFSREFDAAVGPAQRALRMDPDLFWAHLILGWAYQQKEMLEEAIGAYRRAVTQSVGAPITMAALAHALALSGKSEESRDLLHQLEERSRTSYVSAYDIATIHVGLSDTEQAFQWLDRAYDEHSSFLIHIEWDPRFDPIRNDSRFGALLARIGLPRITNPASAVVT